MTRAGGERTAPSGWYPDPVTANTMRWWDGTRWTTIVRPSDPPIDLRGKRLLLVGYMLLTAGGVAAWIAFPWLASEPIAGHKDPNPPWVTVLSVVGPITVVLGVASFVVRLIVRRRPSG